MTLVGDRVHADGEYVGVVEREFRRTWGRRKGDVQSIQVSGMDVTFRRIRNPGILFWSEARKKWMNKLHPDVTYTVRRSKVKWVPAQDHHRGDSKTL